MKINIEKSRAEELEQQRQELQLKMDAINKEMAKIKHGKINAILDETAAKLEKGKFIQVGSQFGKVETWTVNYAKDGFYCNPSIEIIVSEFVAIWHGSGHGSVNIKEVDEIHFQVNSNIEVQEELIFITESRHAAVKEFALQVIGSIERVLNAEDEELPVYSDYDEWFLEFKKEIRNLEYSGYLNFLSFANFEYEFITGVTPNDAAKATIYEMKKLEMM